METIAQRLIVYLLIALISFGPIYSRAQAIAPDKSAGAAAANDGRFVASSIAYDEDIMFLSQKAIDRAADEQVKELAQQMHDDHTSMLYTMEQLQRAANGSSTKSADDENAHERAVTLNNKLSAVSGDRFDTLWVSNLLTIHQARYDELVQKKESVMNTQLKLAITEAIPLTRKHVNRLKSLQKYLARMAAQKKREEQRQK